MCVLCYASTVVLGSKLGAVGCSIRSIGPPARGWQAEDNQTLTLLFGCNDRLNDTAVRRPYETAKANS